MTVHFETRVGICGDSVFTIFPHLHDFDLCSEFVAKCRIASTNSAWFYLQVQETFIAMSETAPSQPTILNKSLSFDIFDILHHKIDRPLQFSLPFTVVYSHNRKLDGFYSDRHGVIARKGQTSLQSLEQILLEIMGHRPEQRTYDIVAQLLLVQAGKISLEYFDKEGLTQFADKAIVGGHGTFEGLLQVLLFTVFIGHSFVFLRRNSFLPLRRTTRSSARCGRRWSVSWKNAWIRGLCLAMAQLTSVQRPLFTTGHDALRP